MIKTKQSVVQLPIYTPGKSVEDVQRELGLSEIVKLASNENPYGCSPHVKDAIIAELNNSNLYPDGASVETTKAVAQFLGVDTNQIIFGAGSDEVILMIARAFLVPGDESVMASHTFSQYKHNVDIEGVTTIEVPLKDGVHDLPSMLAQVTDKTKIVWICNPNNPTGTIVTQSELLSFLRQVPANVMVVLDEAYCEYVEDPEYPDGLGLLKQFPNLVLLRTFSKIYGLASLRIGFGVGHADIIKLINQVRGPFNTTRHAQAAARVALQDQEFIARCRAENSKGLRYLEEQFTRLGLSYFPAHGNFIMVDVQRPAGEVFNQLLHQGFIVRGGHQLNFPTHIRVTVGIREHNEQFVAALEKVLNLVPAL